MLSHGPITLRPLQTEDAAEIALLLNNKKILDNLRDHIPFPYSTDNALFFIDLTKNEQPLLTFAITCDGILCGIIGLVAQKDVYRKSAELGYWIGEPYWNRGMATVAVKLITAYAFHQLGYIRIHAHVFAYNPLSMRVLEKNGYRKEGIAEKAVFKNDCIHDEHRFAITR